MTTLHPSPPLGRGVVRHGAVGARLVDEPGFRFGLAQGVLVLATTAAVVLRLGDDSALVLLGLTAAAAGHEVTRGWSVVLGASCWGFWTGFVEHRLGQLTVAPADLAHLGLLVLLALAGAELARLRGRRRG